MARPDFAAQEVQDRSFELTDQIAGFRPGASTPEEALVTDTVAELGNLIGGSVAGAELRDASDSDHGLFLQYTGADSSWHLRGRAREAGSPAVAAALSFDNQDEDGSLAVSLPLDWAASPATASGIAITYNRYATPVSEVKAFYNYGPLRITSTRDGSAGDSDVVRITGGTAGTNVENADAAIGLSTGELVVVSPDATGTVDEVAGVNPRYGNNAAFMNVRALVPGTAMNGFTLAMRSVRDNSQTETITWSATYSSDNRTLNIVATLNTFDLFTVSTEGLVDAINAARTAQGEQLVEADRVPFGQDGFITINYIRSNDNPLRNINGLVFAGGTHASGPGTPTNRGEVRVVASAARVPGTAATYVWQISSGRQITLTFHQIGTGGNNLQFSIRQDTTNLNANTVDVTDSGADFLVRYNGSVTLGTLVDAMNGAGSRFTVAITQGSRADSVTPSGNISWRTSGGTDTVNPLSAVWDEDAHRLTITALTTDTAAAVSAVIAALDEFSTANLSYTDGGSDSATITVPGTAGEHVDYNFSGGIDAVARTPLAVSDAFVSGTVSRFMITGLIATDSVQDVIDAYSGSRFTIGATPGDDVTDTFTTVTDVNNANLANGLDEVTRQLPSVTLADNGAITISLHAVDDRSDNTTLNELYNAFLAADYTNTAGDTQTLAAASLTLDFSGGGVGTDPLRNQTLPASPSGGVDAVGAGPIEAVVNSDDSYVEIRYLPAEDTLEDVLTALKEQNLIKASGIYGTTLGNTPEAPPFDRTMFRPSSEGVAVGTDIGVGTRTATTLDLTSSTGDDATVPSATTSLAGLMSRADKRTVNATPPAWAAGTHAVGDQVAYDNKIYVCLVARTGSDTSNPSADTTGWAVVGTGSGGGGLSAVSSDATLTGSGTSGDPLEVANPFTDADEAKLDGIAAGAEVNVKSDWNETDSSDDAFIDNKPTLADVATSGQYTDLAGRPNIPQGSVVVGAIPQEVTGTASGSIVPDDEEDITVSAVGAGSFATLGSGGDAGKIVITNAGTYRLYGSIAFTSGGTIGRAGPSFTVDGTNVVVRGFSNPYSREADSPGRTAYRFVDFVVPAGGTAVTLQVANRQISESSAGSTQEAQNIAVTSVSDLFIMPIGGTKGDPGPALPSATQDHIDAIPPLWAAGTYAVGDQVVYDDKLYVCLVARTGSNTSNPSADATGWAPAGRALTDDEEGKLSDSPLKWRAAVHAVGDQAVWDGALYECTVARVAGNTDNPATDTASWRKVSGAPGGGGSFTPSKSNLYSAVKEILHPDTNAGVTADDTNNELDIPGGSGSGSPENTRVVNALRDLALTTLGTGLERNNAVTSDNRVNMTASAVAMRFNAATYAAAAAAIVNGATVRISSSTAEVIFRLTAAPITNSGANLVSALSISYLVGSATTFSAGDTLKVEVYALDTSQLGSSSFAGLSDTPGSLDHGEYVRVNETQDRLEFHDLGREVTGNQQVLGLYGQFLRGLGLSATRTWRTIALDDQAWFRMEVRTNPDPSGLSHDDFGIANFSLHDRASYVAIQVPRGWLPDAVQVRRAANGNTDYPRNGERWLKIDVTGGHPYADYYWLVDADGDPVDLRTAVGGAAAFMRIGALTLAPVMVKYWRDNTATPAVPSDASIIELWPGHGLYDVEFGGPTTDRYVHFAVPEDYVLNTVAVESRNRLSSFSTRTASGERIYDSAQLTSNLADLEILIRISHA